MLTQAMGDVVIESIVSLSHAREWRLHAVVAVSSHLHAVVGAPLMGLTVIREIRQESARLLGELGLLGTASRVWSQGGHFSTIHTVTQLERVVEYVNHHRLHPDGRGR